MTYEERDKEIKLRIVELERKRDEILMKADDIDRNIEYLRAVKAKFDFEPEFMFI